MTSNAQLIQQQAHNPVIVSIISSTAIKTDVASGGDNIEAARQREHPCRSVISITFPKNTSEELLLIT